MRLSRPEELVPPAGVETRDSAVEMSAINVLAAAAAWFFMFPFYIYPPASTRLSLPRARAAIASPGAANCPSRSIMKEGGRVSSCTGTHPPGG